MSPNHRRFLRGSVLSEYRDCARYSEWENRSTPWLSWDIHGKQMTLSLHHLHSYAEESPLRGLSNCYGGISHLFYILLQQHNRREPYDVFCLFWPVTLSFSAISTQDTILQLKRDIFSFHILTLSQILFRRPWFSRYQLNTLHVSSHWSMGWN